LYLSSSQPKVLLGIIFNEMSSHSEKSLIFRSQRITVVTLRIVGRNESS
jgi:hypothetical protein